MAKRKNILYILADQQRFDTVSAYGKNDICRTPHIDALAENGMKFTNAFTPSAICAPARAWSFSAPPPRPRVWKAFASST